MTKLKPARNPGDPQRDRLDEGLLNPSQMALLMGISEQEFTDEWERQKATGADRLTLPKAWIRQGKETAARLGTDNMYEAVRILEIEAAS